MRAMQSVVSLLDVDNTLLDNDAVEADISMHLTQAFGPESRDRYWNFFEELRSELDYADYLGTVQRFRTLHPNDPQLLSLSAFLLDYPFSERLYDGALEAITCLAELGPTVILTDGDVVFQPWKIQRAGLWEAVQGRVLIFLHKEEALDRVAQRYPAQHYIMVDDKPRILATMKQRLNRRLTTVLPRQGHYGRDPKALAPYPPADLTVDRIGALATQDWRAFFAEMVPGSAE